MLVRRGLWAVGAAPPLAAAAGGADPSAAGVVEPDDAAWERVRSLSTSASARPSCPLELSPQHMTTLGPFEPSAGCVRRRRGAKCSA
jgi:hypothetical protein